jgi:hypothetical protein
MSRNTSHRPLNPGRIGVLAYHTFTQLMRMKVFYFLALFAVIVIAANSLELPTHSAPEFRGVDVLYAIKNTSIGCMSIFSLVLAVVATGLLLPRDVEDRTLYTILAKPVPRLDYLLGKLLGVCALIFVSLVVMSLLMNGVLALRTQAVIAEQAAMADALGFAPEAKAERLAQARELGPTWNLQAAVLVVFFRAVVMAAVALLLSTFSTSTLFTAIVGFLVLFIGFFQADAREFYFGGGGLLARAGSGLMSILLPDLQLFNVIDAIIEGKFITAVGLLKLAAVTLFYFVTYVFVSWLIFARKEF